MYVLSWLQFIISIPSIFFIFFYFYISIPSNFDSLWCILSAILLGSMLAVRVLSQLHCGVISLRIQYALPCSLTYSCFGNFLGQIYTFPVKETMGMCLILNQVVNFLLFWLPFLNKTALKKMAWFSILLFCVQNSTLQHYTRYKPSDLCNCVKDLHHLCCNSLSSSLPAIREKYSQHKVSRIRHKLTWN
jgi:hypothetical protein